MSFVEKSNTSSGSIQRRSRESGRAGERESGRAGKAFEEYVLRCLSFSPRLAFQFPDLGPDRAQDCITDVVLSFLSRACPTSMLPDPAAIFRMAVRRASTLITADRARRSREVVWVETGWRMASGDKPGQRMYEALRAEIYPHLPDDQCRRIFHLWCEGERMSAAFAVALGFREPASSEARQQVERVKGRLRKALRRNCEIRESVAAVLGIPSPGPTSRSDSD